LNRWDASTHYDEDSTLPGKTNVCRGSFLRDEDAGSFDGGFFKISPAEARAMDPQQRIMLEVGYEALHRAGFTRTSLEGSPTGVFVGACGMDWVSMMAGAGEGA
ncbi:unnamed protein product, partial [Discosporangium mesarthrocarpum]